MYVIPKCVVAATAVVFLYAVVAAVAQPTVAVDSDGARSNAVETAAISVGKPAASPQPSTPVPAVAGAPAMRPLEADESVSGSEPDPESFDRHGLEIWWQGHMQKKP